MYSKKIESLFLFSFLLFLLCDDKRVRDHLGARQLYSNTRLFVQLCPSALFLLRMHDCLLERIQWRIQLVFCKLFFQILNFIDILTFLINPFSILKNRWKSLWWYRNLSLNSFLIKYWNAHLSVELVVTHLMVKILTILF